MTGGSSAILKGGRESGDFLSMYTNWSSTKLVDVVDCAISYESIKTDVFATADADVTRLLESDTCEAENLQRRNVSFSSTDPDSDSELGVLEARVGSTLEIGAATELVTVAEVCGCGLPD